MTLVRLDNVWALKPRYNVPSAPFALFIVFFLYAFEKLILNQG